MCPSSGGSRSASGRSDCSSSGAARKNRTSRWLQRSQDVSEGVGPDVATERWFYGVNKTGKLSSCERLNSVTGNWISGPEMFPKALCYMGRIILPRPTDGFVDRILQSHDLLSPSQCEFFDPASDRWIAGPPMNTPCACHSLAVLDGEMFGDVKMEVSEVALHWK